MNYKNISIFFFFCCILKGVNERASNHWNRIDAVASVEVLEIK